MLYNHISYWIGSIWHEIKGNIQRHEGVYVRLAPLIPATKGSLNRTTYHITLSPSIETEPSIVNLDE